MPRVPDELPLLKRPKVSGVAPPVPLFSGTSSTASLSTASAAVPEGRGAVRDQPPPVLAFAGPAVGSGGVAQQEAVVSTGSAAVRFHVVFLMDASGSMKLDNRWHSAFAAVWSFVNFLDGMPDVRCSLALFNDTYEVVMKGEEINTEFKDKLSLIHAEHKPKGGGRFLEALRAMDSLCLPAPVVNVGVLLSDGNSTEEVRSVWSDASNSLKGTRRTFGHRCILHTVAFGPFNSSFLQQLARIGGGDFHHSESFSADSLRRVFMKLSVQVSTLRASVLDFGEEALVPLPEKEMEHLDEWQNASPEKHRSISEPHWAWIMKEDGSGRLQPQGDARQVHLHRNPFAKGAQRYAFHLFIPNTETGKNLHLVVKESKFDQMPTSAEAVHTTFLENHRKAEDFARDFKAGCAGLLGRKAAEYSVQFVPAYVIQLDDATADSGFRYVTAERYIQGSYIKMNDNAGFVNSAVNPSLSSVAAAFSHFSFDKSNGNELCVDIQGVGLEWTDPQLHSTRRGFGPADLGKKGMQLFFGSHQCSDFCYELGLCRVRPDTLELGAPVARGEESQWRECLVCMHSERSQMCLPCRHFCLCSGCAAMLLATRQPHCPVCRGAVTTTARLVRDSGTAPPSTFVRLPSR